MTRSPTQDGIRYELIFHAPDGSEPRQVGTCMIDEQGGIGAVSATPGFEAFLAGIAEDLNATAELHVRSIPSRDAIPGAVYLRRIAREDAEFIEALRQHLGTYLGIELRPHSAA